MPRARETLAARQTRAARLELAQMYPRQRFPTRAGLDTRNYAIKKIIGLCADAACAGSAGPRPCQLWALTCAHDESWRCVCMLALAIFDRFGELHRGTPPTPQSEGGKPWLRGMSFACVHMASMLLRSEVQDTAFHANFQWLLYETLVCCGAGDQPARMPARTDHDLVQMMASQGGGGAAAGVVVEYVAAFLRFWAPPTCIPPVDLVDLAWSVCGAEPALSEGGLVAALCAFRAAVPLLCAAVGGHARGALLGQWRADLALVRATASHQAALALHAGDLENVHRRLGAALASSIVA